MKLNNIPIFIAEAGVNHNGKLFIAKKLIKEAKLANADYVKFQLYKTDEVTTKYADKAEYQKNNKNSEKQKEMLSRYQLSQKQILNLYNYAKKINIKFMLSVFDIESLKIFKKLKVDFIKIPSGEINNYPLLNEICKLNTNIIFSTGMANIYEVKKTFNFIKKKIFKNKKIFVLQCTSAYPTPDKEVNLGVLDQFKKMFGKNIGYSDHTIGSEASIVAVSKGAKIIEKHITLNTKMIGPDHSSSLPVKDLKKFIISLKKIKNFFKNNIKSISQSEKKNIRHVRKSIVAKKDILKGEKFTTKNLSIKRPGFGLPPEYLNNLINKKSKYNFKKDQLIEI